jgi:hypothetical protein
MTSKQESSLFTRLLTMATMAGAFAAISTPANAAPLGFAANIDAKVAPIAANLSGVMSTGVALTDFAEVIFVQFYSRIKPPFTQAMAAPAQAPSPLERPSAVETFEAITVLV